MHAAMLLVVLVSALAARGVRSREVDGDRKVGMKIAQCRATCLARVSTLFFFFKRSCSHVRRVVDRRVIPKYRVDFVFFHLLSKIVKAGGLDTRSRAILWCLDHFINQLYAVILLYTVI